MAVTGNNFSSMRDPLNDKPVSGKPAQEASSEVFKKDVSGIFVNSGFKGQGKS